MNRNTENLISVLLPVHNAEPFLRDCLLSIVNQTHSNWELIAIDDGSTDNSLKILRSFANQDKRIKVYANPKNLGISRTLNHAIKLSKGNFLARMDADDIMYKNRLKLQLKFLRENLTVVVVGGQCSVIDSQGKLIGKKTFPLTHTEAYNLAFNRCPVQHPAIMINKNLIPKSFRWYKTKHIPAEDLELFFRLFRFGKFANLSTLVLKYRRHLHNTSLINPHKTYIEAQKVRKLAIKHYGYKPAFIDQALNLIQYFIVSLLPNFLIYPLYLVSTGNFKFNIPNFSLDTRTLIAR